MEYKRRIWIISQILASKYSSNRNIIIMDDDILPTEESVNILIKNIQKEENIYGLYGRKLDKNFRYSTGLFFGNCHIVLTRCLITTMEMCQYFVDNFKHYEYDIVKKSKPFWNGEDILFNLLSIKKINKFPVSLNLSHTNKNIIMENLFSSISVSSDSGHLEYRKNLTQKLVEDLNLKEKLKENKNNKRYLNWIYEIKNSNLIYYFALFALFALLVLLCTRKFKIKILKNAYKKITSRIVN